MKRFSILVVFALCIGLGFMWIPSGQVLADGTETLGPPGISIASGTGIIAAGTGLATGQPGTINFNVPGEVKQVLLYWEGQMSGDADGDTSVEISNNGTTYQTVPGTKIGGRTNFFGTVYSSAYRADITSLSLVNDNGNTTLYVQGLTFTRVANGAGVLVIYDDGSARFRLGIRDGLDLAFKCFSGNLGETVAQTFTFAPSSEDRTAALHMFFSSVNGASSGGAYGFRPSSIEVTVVGVKSVFSNELDSLDGQEWDTLTLPSIFIPAGATSLKVQAFSRDDISPIANICDDPYNPVANFDKLPASFAWTAAALELPGVGCTPGYWKQSQHFGNWTSYSPSTQFSAVFENAFPGKTLLQVLQPQALRGFSNQLSALGRHTVAALLNAAKLGGDFGLTPEEVINLFNSTYPDGDYEKLKNYFEEMNERGCTLGRSEGTTSTAGPSTTSQTTSSAIQSHFPTRR